MAEVCSGYSLLTMPADNACILDYRWADCKTWRINSGISLDFRPCSFVSRVDDRVIRPIDLPTSVPGRHDIENH